MVEGHLQSFALLALKVEDGLSPAVTALMYTCLTK